MFSAKKMPATIRGQNYLTNLIFRKLCHIQIAKCGNYFGKCWKQKSLPILVFLLHRVPVFVVAKQRLVEFCPDAFLGFETGPEIVRKGGSQISHGAKPSFRAFSMLNAEDTFFTIRQSDK